MPQPAPVLGQQRTVDAQLVLCGAVHRVGGRGLRAARDDEARGARRDLVEDEEGEERERQDEQQAGEQAPDDEDGHVSVLGSRALRRPSPTSARHRTVTKSAAAGAVLTSVDVAPAMRLPWFGL